MLGAAVRTCEQCIFPVERDGADGALDGVVVEFDAAIVDEARQAFPARQGVTDGLGELALLADQAEFCTQPRLKGIDSRPAFLLANGATLVGTAATDFFRSEEHTSELQSQSNLVCRLLLEYKTTK